MQYQAVILRGMTCINEHSQVNLLLRHVIRNLRETLNTNVHLIVADRNFLVFLFATDITDFGRRNQAVAYRIIKTAKWEYNINAPFDVRAELICSAYLFAACLYNFIR